MARSEVASSLLWTEKYRPQKLEEVAMEPENRQVLQSYLDAGEIPHLLLLGPAGSGKTTMARILLRHLDCTVLTLNASAERGIDTVRDKIGSFVTSMMMGRWNIVFLDEADAMTSDAQTAMRNLMESYSDRARFILTANYGSRIIGPIQSRCQTLEFNRPPLKERFRILERILQAEGITFDPRAALAYVERFPDLRQMLWAVQRSCLSTDEKGGKVTLPPAGQGAIASGVELLEKVKKKEFSAFTALTKSGAFDAQDILREMFRAVPDNHPDVGFFRVKLGRGVHETGYTPDPAVLFLTVISEIMYKVDG